MSPKTAKLSKAQVPSREGFYEWSVVGKPVSALLNPNIVRGLRSQHWTAVESGGILVGRVHSSGMHRRVNVEDCEPLVWDNSRGGAPALDAKQRQLLERSLDRWQWQPEADFSAVGFYRTQHGGDLRLTDADIELLDRYFRLPTDICLLLQPGEGRFTAALFIREEGEFLSRDSSYLEFEMPPPDERAEPAVAVPAVGPQWSRAKLAVVTAAVAVTTTIVSWELAPPNRNPPAIAKAGGSSPEAGLGLQVKRMGTNLLLTWNPGAPGIVKAESGWIALTDSGVNRRIALTGTDIQSGQFVYRSTGGDVTLRLEMLADSHIVSDGVRVIRGGASGEAITADARRPAASRDRMERVDSTGASKNDWKARPDSPRSSIEKPPESRPVAGRDGVESQTHTTSPPSTKEPETRSELLASNRNETPSEPLPGAPAPHAPVVLASSPASLGQTPVLPVRSGPLPATPPDSAVTAATIVKRTPFLLPSGVRLSAPVDLELKVELDATGKVITAQAVTTPKATSGLDRSQSWRVTAEAVSIIRHWTFVPATVNGKAVPSSTTVVFHIKPANQ